MTILFPLRTIFFKKESYNKIVCFMFYNPINVSFLILLIYTFIFELGFLFLTFLTLLTFTFFCFFSFFWLHIFFSVLINVFFFLVRQHIYTFFSFFHLKYIFSSPIEGNEKKNFLIVFFFFVRLIYCQIS